MKFEKHLMFFVDSKMKKKISYENYAWKSGVADIVFILTLT